MEKRVIETLGLTALAAAWGIVAWLTVSVL